jgi:hypothetical protein
MSFLTTLVVLAIMGISGVALYEPICGPEDPRYRENVEYECNEKTNSHNDTNVPSKLLNNWTNA